MMSSYIIEVWHHDTRRVFVVVALAWCVHYHERNVAELPIERIPLEVEFTRQICQHAHVILDGVSYARGHVSWIDNDVQQFANHNIVSLFLSLIKDIIYTTQKVVNDIVAIQFECVK